MKRVKNSELRIKSLLLVFLIFCTLNSTFLISPVFAQDSSPSADFKTKLKILQEEIASKAANLKSEVNKRLLNKVYAGFIKTISENGINLAPDSNPKNIILNEYTEYSAKTSKISLKNLAEQDFIIALGDSDEKGVLTAKKVIKTSSNSATLQQAFYGSVTSVTPNITINTNQGTKLKIITDKNTTFQLGKNTADIKKVLVGKPIIALGELNGENLSTRFIYIYPYAATKPLSISSSSALPAGRQASPSGKQN